MKKVKVIKKKEEDGIFSYIIKSKHEFNENDFLFVEEEQDAGTNAQNRFFHAVINDVFCSGGWSIDGISEEAQKSMKLLEFRNFILVNFGQGYEYFVYNDNGITKYSKKMVFGIMNIIGIPKSWADYTKEERRSCISAFMAWVRQMGIDSVLEKYEVQINSGLFS